ncbi:MAG: hypothetical protein F4Z35_08775, partial [Dehalococcoidia bacterium]|nr:hypothetical protein [Dehalococcoidia bacterium]
MAPDHIARAAGKLAGSWQENEIIERLSGELCPQDLEAAIAIQDELARLIGQKVVGWKVGGELVGRIFQPNLLR